MTTEATINGVDLRELQSFREKTLEDPSCADRNPIALAEWKGGDRSLVRIGDETIEMNAPGTLSPMQLLLASLAACDVDVASQHAALLGLKLESLSVEAKGHFNVRSYIGLEDVPGSGYDGIDYTIRLRAPGASTEQIARLRQAIERSSPVGDSLTRSVPLRLSVEVETA